MVFFTALCYYVFIKTYIMGGTLMDFWSAVIWIVGLGCGTGIVSHVIDCNHKYRQIKMQESSKTNNLAILCQMLNNRPDISLEDVTKYIESNDRKTM